MLIITTTLSALLAKVTLIRTGYLVTGCSKNFFHGWELNIISVIGVRRSFIKGIRGWRIEGGL